MSANGKGSPFGKVETVINEEIECANCHKKAEADFIVINELQSYHFTTLPHGWLAEVGLCDMSGLACSVDCARKICE